MGQYMSRSGLKAAKSPQQPTNTSEIPLNPELTEVRGCGRSQAQGWTQICRMNPHASTCQKARKCSRDNGVTGKGRNWLEGLPFGQAWDNLSNTRQ